MTSEQTFDDKLAFNQFKQSRVCNYLQTKLQEKYDIICNMFITCYTKNLEEGCKEYLARKLEIEEIADWLDIKLLKERPLCKLLKRVNSDKENDYE